MNTFVIAGIICAVLFIGGIAFVSAISINQTDAPQEITSCQSCGGQCTAGNNCGLATCGAANGGTCGCGQR